MSTNRYEFRTIEEFVLLLEDRKAWFQRAAFQTAGNEVTDKMAQQAVACYDAVIAVVRNSNIGIVYPPESK